MSTTLDLAELRRLDAAHHLHPFTDHVAMHKAGTHVIRSARGSTLVDETGRELLDALAGLWCVNIGYGRDEIRAAVDAQMREVAFYPSFFNTSTEPTIRLAARLAELAPPGLGHVIFSNSGSEANETALKQHRGEMIEHLRAMEQAADKLDHSGWSTNHPKVDTNMPTFRRDLKLAREGIEREPPNFLLAVLLRGACDNCHGSK